jgi:hypothetical protein
MSRVEIKGKFSVEGSRRVDPKVARYLTRYVLFLDGMLSSLLCESSRYGMKYFYLTISRLRQNNLNRYHVSESCRDSREYVVESVGGICTY